MGHSPAFQQFVRALRLSATPDASPQFEVNHLSRREFLIRAGTAGLVLSTGVSLGQRPKAKNDADGPRVAILGGGMAGLAALHYLRNAGVNATVYEAANRLGGRMMTASELIGPGTYTDLGGEFVNSDHEDVLKLVSDYGLELNDTFAESEAGLIREGFYFDNRLIGMEELVEACRPYVELIARDTQRLEDEEDTAYPELDALSAAAYLDKLGMNGWVRQLFDVMLATEFGRDAGEQTCLYLLWLMPDIHRDELRILGESDEQYRIRGGSGALIEAMAKRHAERIETGRKLEAVHAKDGGFRLSFEGGREADAEVVICSIPFSILRQIDLRLGSDVPATLQQFIKELDYGTNSKVVAGFHGRPWREMGYQGTFYGAERYQLAWEHTLQQAGETSGLTFFHGGKLGLEIGEGTPAEEFSRSFPGFSRTVPAATEDRHNGKVGRFVWGTSPLALGSYACFRPGQYTSFIWDHMYFADDDPGTPVAVGNFHFAGEHVCDEYQGYMNGGASSGRRAAEAVLASMAVIR